MLCKVYTSVPSNAADCQPMTAVDSVQKRLHLQRKVIFEGLNNVINTE